LSILSKANKYARKYSVERQILREGVRGGIVHLRTLLSGYVQFNILKKNYIIIKKIYPLLAGISG